MDTESIKFNDLIKHIRELKKIKITVIGDIIVDTVSNCKVIGGLHKTPTLSIQVADSKDYIGGAAIVAAHLKSFSDNVEIISTLGNDKKEFCKIELDRLGIKKIFYENTRPTTIKLFFRTKHKLIKIDTVNNNYIGEEILNLMIAHIKKVNNFFFLTSDMVSLITRL